MPHAENTVPLIILLADDDKDDRYFFENALKEIPFNTVLKTVPDGARLMEYLMKKSSQLPDVLFLDHNMPRKNGSECLIEIKGDERLKHIPVVLCSTSLGDDFANSLYQSGAHSYLHKCDFSELKLCILKVLNLISENPLQPTREHFMLSLQEM